MSGPFYIWPDYIVNLSGAINYNGGYAVSAVSNDGLTVTLPFSCPLALGGSPVLTVPFFTAVLSLRMAAKMAFDPMAQSNAVSYMTTSIKYFAASGGTFPSIFEITGQNDAWATFDPDFYHTPDPNWPAFVAHSGGHYPYLLKARPGPFR